MELSVNTTSLADEAISSGACEVTTWAEPIAPMRYRWAKTDRLIERGMATAEYAVGILAAVALALVLFKVFSGNEFAGKMLKFVTDLITKAATFLPKQ